MPLIFIRNDITKLDVDVIVNSAAPEPVIGSGVDYAIHEAAGISLLDARQLIGDLTVGEAAMTPGFDLLARSVIHTVGPIWQGGKNDEAKLLRQCYIASLELATSYEKQSIAFPIISSGVYGYPKIEALKVAIHAIHDFLENSEMFVYLVVYDVESFKVSTTLTDQVTSFISDHYVEEKEALRNISYMKESHSLPRKKLEGFETRLGETFAETLLRTIDEKGMTDVEVYKKANIDRKLFSKIRSIPGYHPSKGTAISLSLALKLNYDQTKDLIGRAGYALSDSNRFDLVIQYFIEENNYDIYEINQVLFHFDLPTLSY